MSEAGFGIGVSVNCIWSTTFGVACPWARIIGRVPARIARTRAKANNNRGFIFLFPLSTIRNFHFAFSATYQYTPSCLRSASLCIRSNARPGRARLGRLQDQRAIIYPVSKHSFGHFLRQLPSIVQVGFAWLPRLPGWQRQSLHPAQHVSKQASREMALRYR